MKLRSRVLEYSPLLVALAIYLIPALAALNLGAPNEDDAVTVIPLMQFARGEPIDGPIWSTQLFDRQVPWVVGPYTGLLHPISNAIGFSLFGYNLAFIRLIPTLYGAATLVLTFLLARTLFSMVVAGIAVVMLAANPAFVFWHWLEGYHSYFSMVVFSTASLLCLTEYARHRRTRYLVAGAFLAGLGLATKLNFIYWLALYAVAALVFVIRERRWLRQTALEEPIALGIIGFALGAAPWLSFAFTHQPVMAAILLPLFGGTSAAGVSNLAIGANVSLRLNQLADMLSGTNYSSYFTCAPAVPGNPLLPFFLGVGYVAIALTLLRRSTEFSKLALALLLFALPLFVVMSAITPTGLTIYNGSIYYPIPHLIIAAGVVILLARFRGGRNLLRWLPAPIAAIVLGLVLSAADIRNTSATYAMLYRTNGCGQMAGAMTDLVRYLDGAGISQPIAMDWGLHKPVYLLSDGRVRPSENFVGFFDGKIWSVEPPPTLGETLARLVPNRDNVYLFHSPQYTNMQGRRELLERIAAAAGRTVVVDRVFNQGDGKPLFLIVRVI